MTGLFISYRQADSKAWAITLRDDLAKVFGEEHVFLDKDTLHAGNWREQIQRELERCKVVIVIIGPNWLTAVDERNRPRIQLGDDVHHQEIAFALGRSAVTVIPVLVDDASMPRPDQLPPDLQKLNDQQARKIGDTQARRKADLGVLVNDIQSVGGLRPLGQSPGPAGSDSRPARIGWLRLDKTPLALAFALTLAAGMFAYLVNSTLGVSELTFLFAIFYVLVQTVRWLRARGRHG